jgi:uncharacterized protein (DUF58 family)
MTSLGLPGDWINRIARFSIATKSKIHGHHKGTHRSVRFGSSLDFSDFREYHPGDDVRHVDWNVYARTDRVYIKRFLDEQEMRVHILVDSSKSMANKWLFAKQLAFSLGLMVLSHDDRLTVSAGQTSIAPFKKKGKSARMLYEHFIANLPQPEKLTFAKEAGFHAAKDSTVLFVVTDGLEPLEEWQTFFRQVPRFSHDFRFLHLMAEEERNPGFSGDVRLIDEETDRTVNVTIASQALQTYAGKREQHTAGLKALCAKYGVHYMEIQIEDGIQHVLFQQLARKNWIE